MAIRVARLKAMGYQEQKREQAAGIGNRESGIGATT
jgi:hypothetical protein